MYFADVKQAVFCWRGMVGRDSDVIQSRPPEACLRRMRYLAEFLFGL